MKLLQDRRWAAIGVGVLLLLALLTWIGMSLWPDPHMARVQELRQELTAANARNLSRAERRDKWKELRTEMDQLSPDQKRKLNEERNKARRERMDKFFKMSKAEQTAALDKMIDRMQQARAQANQGRQGPRAGNGGGGGRGRSLDPEERQRRRQQYLDNTTPEDRAQRSLFRQMLTNRMQQRGLPAGGGWGGPWMGGRGG